MLLHHKCNRMLSFVIVFSMLAGCASPTVRWSTPDQKDVREHSMAYAKAYAHSAREAYQQAVDREVQAGTNLSSGLIGLGGILAGLATFGAHRDAIVGGALIGGTAYALGNWNLSKQRQLVYLAGVEAINCSVKAVSPFDMPESDRQALNDGLAQLERRLGEVTLGIDRVATAARNGGTEALHAEADQTVTHARAISASSREVLIGGRQIATKVHRAGGELVAAVDRVGAAVDKAVLDTIPDLASVKMVVGGIAGFAGALVPGSAIESRITQAMKDVGAKPEGRKLVPSPAQAALARAIDDLVVSTEHLASEAAKVRSRTIAFDPAATTAGLADCGVTVSSGLTATPSAVVLKGGVDETHTIIVDGGTSPYIVRRQGAQPSGLTIIEPVPYDTSVIVQGSAALAKGQSFSILIMDSSKPHKSKEVSITVGGTVSPSGGTPPPTTAAANPFVARIVKLTQEFDVGGTKVAVVPPVEDLGAGRVRVNIECKSKPSTPLSQDSVITALLQQQVAGSAIAADASVDGADPATKFDIAGAADCVAPRPQGRSLRPKAAVPAGDLQALQRRLCLPPFAVDGKWGPITRAALDNWRTKNGIAKLGTPPTTDEHKRIIAADAATAAKWCAE